MLSRRDYLILCAIEELGEVQKELSKCLRFTCDHRLKNSSNLERAKLEWLDFLGVVAMLREEGLELQPECSEESAMYIREGMKKREKYYHISRELGVVP